MKKNLIIGTVLVLVTGLLGWFLILQGKQSQQQALFYQSDVISVPEGTLIRAQGDERVYYAQDGHRRWIDSFQTFQAQGFKPENIRTVTTGELQRYPEGEPITTLTRLVMPAEEKMLPDLAPLAPYQLHLASVGGRTVIKFTGSFWNKGYQPFQLLSENQSVSGVAGSEDVYQRVLASDGTERKKFVGTFVWHPAHHHHHFDNFAEYLFEPAELIPGTRSGPSVRQKTTFCMRDDLRMPADVPNVPLKPVFTDCGPQGQGVSAGWIDVYPNTLVDQFVDVQDMPPGIYGLSFSLDPLKRLIEEHDNNDIATTLVQLDVQNRILRVIGTLSPFPTMRNHVDDGTLLRNADDGNVYVVQHDRKRWLRTADIFLSYGYAWNFVYPATKAMIDAIPSQQLIRRQGTQEVFMLNDQGFIRHILSPEVFASYSFTASDVTDINDVDFVSYGVSNLIMRSGDTQVYSTEGTTKQPLGTLTQLQAVGRDLRGLHLVNQTDFDAYATL